MFIAATSALVVVLAQHAESAAPHASTALLSPVWVIVFIAVAAVPAFLILHLVLTVLLMGRPYEFPLKLAIRGPKYCPHCGKEMDHRRANARTA